jgi:anti-anti-sigma factor
MVFSVELKTPPNFSTERFETDKLVLQIFLTKNFDIYNSMELFLFVKVLETGGLNKILLDLENLDYIDSSGIGVLIKGTKVLRARKGEIAMLNVPESVKKVFGLIKLERLIRIFNSETDALSYLRMK